MLVPGPEACTSGLSKRIYDKRKARAESSASYSKLDATQKEEILSGIKKDSYDVALSVVDEFQANADVLGVATTVSTAVTGTLPAGPVAAVGAGAGTQSNIGNVQ